MPFPDPELRTMTRPVTAAMRRATVAALLVVGVLLSVPAASSAASRGATHIVQLRPGVGMADGAAAVDSP